MTIPLVPVSVLLEDAEGRAIPGAVVTAKLSAPIIGAAIVSPGAVSETTDANGTCVLHLIPNSVGIKPTTYTFQIAVPNQFKRLRFKNISVPDVQQVSLEELLGGSPQAPTVIHFMAPTTVMSPNAIWG